MRTQSQDILAYMTQYGGITQLEATTMLGCTRLSARISDLKKEGHVIRSVWKSGTTRTGRKTNYVEYQIANRDPGHFSVAE